MFTPFIKQVQQIKIIFKKVMVDQNETGRHISRQSYTMTQSN